MKIFLSYGHDKNTPIALRIKKDLEAAGHLVWIDSSEIKAGDDWRRSIIDGLSNSDWTLGLLSQHSVRNPGVCLDELAIALYVKGGTIATVLVEAEAAASPPVSVSAIQWLDMHDWSERLAGNTESGEKWYRSKFNEILTLLASPAAQRFAGEIKELDEKLLPISQLADIGEKVDGFIGREWLRSKLDDWRKNARDSRLYWISGAPGTGKSAFAAWLAHRGSVNVIALNLCRYNVDERKDPARVLRTIAFQIATRLPDYRRLLSERFHQQDPLGLELNRKSVAALFDWLLAEPLGLAIDGGRSSDRYLIVIDALDETIREGRSELAEVFAESCQKLPRWIAVVVTSRPEHSILRQFAGLRPQTIEAESDENLNDLRAYARRWLAIESRGAGETEARAERMVAASQGNFLYLRMLTEAATKGLIDLDHPDGLPQGLVGFYERWFRRQFPNAAEFETYLPFFEVLVAAEHPVPEIWFDRILGWSKRDKAKMLEHVGSLVERRGDGIAPFHKSLGDWLTDTLSSGATFVIDTTIGANRLMNALWPAFIAWTEDSENHPLDRFCEVELASQLTGPDSEPGRLRQFAQLLCNPDVIRRRLLVGTDADAETRFKARHDFVDFIVRTEGVWPKGVDLAPAKECARVMTEVAWHSLRGVHLAASAKEPVQSILELVSAVHLASGPEALEFVMDQRLRDLIYKFYHSPGFEDYTLGHTDNLGDASISFLEEAIEKKFNGNKNNPRLATWVKEWSEFFQEGYRPPWATSN
jgi:hypothetical protein